MLFLVSGNAKKLAKVNIFRKVTSPKKTTPTQSEKVVKDFENTFLQIEKNPGNIAVQVDDDKPMVVSKPEEEQSKPSDSKMKGVRDAIDDGDLRRKI